MSKPFAAKQRLTTITIHDPSTEERIGEFIDGGAEAVDSAVARARNSSASSAWRSKTPPERTRTVFPGADLIEQPVDEIGASDSRNVGMSRAHARNLVFAAAEQIRYFAGWCTKIYDKSADVKMAGGITGETGALLGYRLKEPADVARAIVL